jgi:hypothetical protein
MKRLGFLLVLIVALGMASGVISRGQARRHDYASYTPEQLAVKAEEILEGVIR